MSDLVSHFENPDDNCEFGFVQRAAGHEEGELFRWALVSGVAPLIARLIDRFAPYDRADDVSLDVWLSICRNALACQARDAMSARV
jgi:hypothetical protein